MIISHEHRFIFIKTNKTAGTSVEIALSKFCGPQDVITKISRVDEETRQALGFTGAQNFYANEFSLRSVMSSLRGKPKKPTFYNHMPGSRIRKLIPRNTWDGYFKFCIERNPWDRVISAYYWKNRKEPDLTMIDWLHKGGHRILQERGRDLYTIDGNIVVDHVVRYENLAEELETVRLKLGLPEPLELPNAKSGVRRNKRHYREILSEEEKEIIEKDFAFEISNFGYAF